jgi:hypothetical protein
MQASKRVLTARKAKKKKYGPTPEWAAMAR